MNARYIARATSTTRRHSLNPSTFSVETHHSRGSPAMPLKTWRSAPGQTYEIVGGGTVNPLRTQARAALTAPGRHTMAVAEGGTWNVDPRERFGAGEDAFLFERAPQ